MDTPQNDEVAVPDLAQNKAQAESAFDEVCERVKALHDKLEGVSAAARADLAFVINMLRHARTKL